MGRQQRDRPELLPQRIVFRNGQLHSELTALDSGCQWMELSQGKYQLVVKGKLSSPLGLYHFFERGEVVELGPSELSLLVEEGGHCQLLELTWAVEGPGGPGAQFHRRWELQTESVVEHLRVFCTSQGGEWVSQTEACVAAKANYSDTVLALGGGVCNQVQVELQDEGAHTSLGGLFYHLDRENSSHATCIQHRAPRTTSRQLYKGLLDHHSRASFDGTILVGPDCPGVEAHQLNKNILLSETAWVNSRPQLQIDHCDVQCTHGSTTGQLNPEEVFYLRSRGLSLDDSRQLLAQAFCQDVVEQVECAILRDAGRAMLEERMS